MTINLKFRVLTDWNDELKTILVMILQNAHFWVVKNIFRLRRLQKT